MQLYKLLLVIAFVAIFASQWASAVIFPGVEINITNPVEGRNYNSSFDLHYLRYTYSLNSSLSLRECWWGNETYNRSVITAMPWCAIPSPTTISIRWIGDNPMASSLGESTGNHTWYVYIVDSLNRTNSVNVSFSVGSPSLLPPCPVNITGGWTNVSCLVSNLTNQTRVLTNYSGPSCSIQTFSEYRVSGACNTSYICINTLTNLTTSWADIGCLSTNKMNQTRNISQYDSGFCGNVTNMSFLDYRATVDCIYNNSCYTNWTCSYWDACNISNVQSRICLKTNASCNLPIVSLIQNCTYVAPIVPNLTIVLNDTNISEPVEEPPVDEGWGFWAWVLLIVIGLVVLGFLIWWLYNRYGPADSPGRLVNSKLTPEQKEQQRLLKQKLAEEALAKQLTSEDINEYLKERNQK